MEMQIVNRQNFQQRIPYDWSRLYSRAIIRGETYKKLSKVYSINFSLLKEEKNLYWNFKILAEQNPKIQFTDDLSIRIIELPKSNQLEEKISTLQHSINGFIF
jgi:predicted transposase/invertase (TIGR01784 family)